MPCGGIYPLTPEVGCPCWTCNKTEPPPDHALEEWDSFIHGACVAEFLETDEGQIVLDHGHEVIVRIGGKTTVVHRGKAPTKKLSVDDIARIRTAYEAWEPYRSSTHRDFAEVAYDNFPVLLDLATEALRVRALEAKCRAVELCLTEEDEDAQLTLCGKHISVAHVRHVLRYLRGDQ